MHIDLAGRTSNELDHLSEVIQSVCNVHTEPDGIEFDPSSMEAARINTSHHSSINALPRRRSGSFE
jgi:hypothetical protein